MAGIKDVAALAGVSISTVSYVMTGKRPIGANTRRRVLQAARELGYLAKNGGPAPLSGETHFVALSSPVHDFTSYTKLDIENPIIRINTAFKGCSSLEKISVLPRIYHN